jgi:hypothetical protein
MLFFLIDVDISYVLIQVLDTLKHPETMALPWCEHL